MSMFVETAVAITAVAACVWDVRSRRIPNAVTFGSAALALVFQTASGGFGGAASSLGGLALGLALFLPFFVAGAMGGGDVKLLAAIGAWLGPSHVLWAALYAMVAGGVLALIVMLARRQARETWERLTLLIWQWRVTGRAASAGPGSADRTVAYALPIAVGAAVSLWLK